VGAEKLAVGTKIPLFGLNGLAKATALVGAVLEAPSLALTGDEGSLMSEASEVLPVEGAELRSENCEVTAKLQSRSDSGLQVVPKII
jgi:hypothetical protein